MIDILKKHAGFLIVLLVSYFSIQSLFLPGFFSMHDDTQVARVYEMKTALADGMFPVRWVPDLGYNYGYPIFNFYGPFAYYVGGVVNLFGFDSLTATKIMIGLGTILAGAGMFLFAKEFWGKTGATVAAVLYMYAPYHAVNIYVRGAIGELWAYGLIPLAFFGLYKIFQATLTKPAATKPKVHGKKQKNVWLWITLSALAYAAIIISHNLSAMMVTPFLFGFALLLYIFSRNEPYGKNAYFILLSLLIGVLIAAFYWLPALFEMKYTNVVSVVGGGSDYVDHFVCINQLWESQWGYAGSTPGCIDGMSFKLGKLHIILALISVLPLLFFRKNKKILVTLFLTYVGTGFSTFLMTDYSKFIWDAIPHMAFFQFPWRFLVLATFFLSFLGGAIFLFFPKHQIAQWLAVVAIICVTLFLNIKLFSPDRIVNKTNAEYIDKSQITWLTSKISDEYMPPGFIKPLGYSQVPKRKIPEKQGVLIESYREKTQKVSAIITAKKKTDMHVNIAYFPGWHVYIDGKQEYFKFYNRGLIVTIPQGKHTLEIAFSQTPVERTANAISIAGIFILLAGIIFSRKERKRV